MKPDEPKSSTETPSMNMSDTKSDPPAKPRPLSPPVSQPSSSSLLLSRGIRVYPTKAIARRQRA